MIQGHEMVPKNYLEQFDKTVQKMNNQLEKYLSDPNEKNIHEVRISIRRFLMASRILPKKVRQKPKVKNFIEFHKKFFKTNSKIRDFDIISSKLSPYPEVQEILKLIENEKEEKIRLAQKQAKLSTKLGFPKIKHKRISQVRLENNFRKKSVKMIENIQVLLPKVLSSDEMVSELHELRKECKKLRYLLELSSTSISSDFIAKLKQMQEVLGAIHDSDITTDFLKRTFAEENKFEHILKKEIETRLELYNKLVNMHNTSQNSVLTK